LKDIKGEKELGVVARMAARRFDLPGAVDWRSDCGRRQQEVDDRFTVYSKDSRNRDRLPAKAGKGDVSLGLKRGGARRGCSPFSPSQALERMLQVFESLWDSKDARLQGAVCIMLSKLALDDNLRPQVTSKSEHARLNGESELIEAYSTDWLPKVFTLLSSADSTLALASLNAIAELVHKGETHGIPKGDLPAMSDRILDMSTQLKGRSETDRIVLKSLGRLVGHCEGCSQVRLLPFFCRRALTERLIADSNCQQAVDPNRLRPLLLAALSKGYVARCSVSSFRPLLTHSQITEISKCVRWLPPYLSRSLESIRR